MTIEKLPSGSYRIRKTINKKTYSVTVNYKPKKYEAEELIHAKIYGENSALPYSDTVLSLAEEFILKGQEEKSPTTTNSYRSILKNTPSWFLDTKIADVTEVKIQKVVDEYSKNHSPKSVHNFNGFYKCVFAEIKHLKNYSIKLPKKVKKAEYEPTTDDIQRILEYSKNSRYNCVLNLLCIGLRRGEAIAITSADLDKDDVLTINKDIVYDGITRTYVVKDHPKTEASNRRIKIPNHIAEMIRAQEQVFVGNPHTINEYLHKVQDALGIPRFRLHMLRHFAAALLHTEFSDKAVMEYMGWDCISTMHGVYSYNLNPSERHGDIARVLSSALSVTIS